MTAPEAIKDTHRRTAEKYGFRTAAHSDIPELRSLFTETVLTINRKDYTQDEVEDWASCGEAAAHWEDLLGRLHFIVATESGGRIAGFTSISDEGYLHSMFVHRDLQGKGIATALLSRAEEYARSHGIPCMKSDVSITARPFFERHGYTVEKEQKAKARLLYMTNFRMTKAL